MQNRIAALQQELRMCRQSLNQETPVGIDYRSLVENANEAILVAQNGTFQYANPKAEELLGYALEELAAQPLTAFIHASDREMVRQQYERRIRGDDLPEVYPFRIVNKDGATIWVELKVKLFSWHRQPATLCLMTDISQRIHTEKKYQRALASRREGFMLLDNDRMINDVNPALLEISGYRREDFVGHPADKFYDRASVDFFSASPDHFSFEALFRARDGRKIPMLFSRSTLKDDRDRPTGFMYFLTDLTELKITQEALKKAERRYRMMYENAVQGMFQSHLSGALIRANPAFARILGYASVDEVLSLEDGAKQFYFHASDRVRMLQAVLKKGALVNHELRLKRKDGQAVWILANIRCIRNVEGKIILEGILVDNTRRKKLEQKLKNDRKKFKKLAIHNNLTGLYNTRYLYQKLDQIIAESKRTRKPFSLVFMDMDHFKHVVDTYGHLNGSRALKEVAATIKSCLQQPCFGVAYGGDEFVVVLPGFDKQRATRKLEQIRARMKATTYLTRAGHQVRLGASFGIATFPNDSDNREGLLALADQAMFHVKQTDKGTIGVIP
ncbi:MAG: PAS domain S-box protein [Desulfobacterales bacterium]|nr:PAS domain S-box protein [Desulfobacterales bacterium]